MPASDKVPVFYRDDDDLSPAPFLLTRAECRERKNILGKFFDSGRKFRLFATRPKVYPVTAADLSSSNVIPLASAITNSELLANVGIAGEEVGTPAPRHLVRRARQKIRAYLDKDMRETQAPTAYGLWINPQAIQVTAIP